MKKFDVSAFMLNRFLDYRFDANHKNIRVHCPFCGYREKTLYVKIVGYAVAHCFHCKYKASFVDFVKDFEGYDNYKDVYLSLSSFYSEIEDKKISLSEEKNVDDLFDNTVSDIKQDLFLPEDYEPVKTEARDAYLAQMYLQKRGFSVEYSSSYNIGYCTRGRYRNRIIIPTYKKGELAYYVARRYIEEDSKKVLASSQVKYPEAIFNLDRASEYNTIYITEGWADAMSVGYNGVALNGKEISLSKISQLVQLKNKVLIVMLDDTAHLDSLHIAFELSKRHDNIYCAFIAEGCGDPNEVYLRNNYDKVKLEKFEDNSTMPKVSFNFKDTSNILFD